MKTKRILIGFSSIIVGLSINTIFGQDTGNLPDILIDTGTNNIVIQGYYTNSSGEILLESGYYSPYLSGNSGTVENSSNTGENLTTSGNVNTGSESNISGNNLVNTGTTPNFDIQLNSGNMLSEFGQALAWMYTNQITSWGTEKEYMPDDFLTREQATKILGKTYQVLGYPDIVKNSKCSFLDQNLITPVFLNDVANSCKRGLFKGNLEGKFMPVNQISKAEIMVVLIRMFEGKISDENAIPRRNVYYKKGYAIGITNQQNGSGFENSITRREMAIFMYRLKNIVTNEKLKMLSLNTISQIKPDIVANKGTGTKNEIIDNLSAIANNINAINDPELQAAIGWMFDNGLTSFNSITEYKPFDVLLRLQAAKILTIFSEVFNLNSNLDNFVGNECNFSDLGSVSSEFKQYIEKSCKLGLLKGQDGKFNPEGELYKSQFIVSLIRLFEGKHLDETSTPWWKNYFWKAQELGIVGPSDVITFDSPITRYEMALFLYRFKIKYQIIQNMNTNRIPNEVITTVPGTTMTGSDGKLEANVYLDTNLLKDGNFEIGYIDIFGNRYKIVKTDLVKYFTTSFVRYGDVFNMESETKIGTVSFVVNNSYVIETNVRLPNVSYKVIPIEGISTYYKINQL